MLPRLLLIGSGPTHLLLLERLAHHREPAREALLVAPVQTEMSPGTLPGLLAGRYRPSEIGVNLERLAQAAGVRLKVGQVRSIDPVERTVRLENGEILLYNAASVAISPFPSSSAVPGAGKFSRFVHTLDQAMDLVPGLERAVDQATENIARVIVVGGSPEALEIALTLRTVLDRLTKARGVVTLVGPAHALWMERGSSARLAKAALGRNDITAILGAEAVEITDRQLRLSNGARVSFDLLVWATGERSSDYLENPGLRVDGERYPVVDEHLQASDTVGLFIAGEVTMKQDDRVTRLGTDPPEAARVIGDNLLAVLAGQAPRRAYNLRKRFQLAEAGGERALLSFGDWGWEGKWLLALKQRADRRLIRQLSHPPGVPA